MTIEKSVNKSHNDNDSISTNNSLDISQFLTLNEVRDEGKPDDVKDDGKPDLLDNPNLGIEL